MRKRKEVRREGKCRGKGSVHVLDRRGTKRDEEHLSFELPGSGRWIRHGSLMSGDKALIDQ